MAEEEHQSDEGLLRVLKWDLGLFEQITRGFRFPREWDARYRDQNQTAADAPPRYITLFEDLFLQGNFRLPATEFLSHILHFYGFHLSQMSPPGIVRVRHFEFLCQSHNIEPTLEKFRAFYQLIRNMDFYSFGNRGSAKKILLNPPKSFHDWKQKFFFIREEVIPIAMIFRAPDVLRRRSCRSPRRLTGSQMSDRCPEDSTQVPVLKFEDRGCFPHFRWVHGRAPVGTRGTILV
ncbi:hypothetical protein Hanom_Chr12g01157971 [Helianthus anomalus]